MTKTRKLTQDDLHFLGIAAQGAKDCQTTGLNNPYMDTSESSDAYQIGAWDAYHHGGSGPRYLHKSKGHSWIMETSNFHTLRVVVESRNHRDGVKILATV